MVPTAITYIVAGLGVFCLEAMAGTFVRYHRNRNPHPIAFSEILVFLNWVDIEGLRKLIDPMEEAFLRQSLSRIEFGKLQAERIRGASQHFRKIVTNATELQSFGYRHLNAPDATKRLLAFRLINFAVSVRMCARTGIFVLSIWKVLRVLRHVLVSLSLPDLKDLVEETLKGYQELKEAALALAMYAEPGIEKELFPRL